MILQLAPFSIHTTFSDVTHFERFLKYS